MSQAQAISDLLANRRQRIESDSDNDSESVSSAELADDGLDVDQQKELRKMMSHEAIKIDRSVTPTPLIFQTLASQEQDTPLPGAFPPPPPPLPEFLSANSHKGKEPVRDLSPSKPIHPPELTDHPLILKDLIEAPQPAKAPVRRHERTRSEPLRQRKTPKPLPLQPTKAKVRASNVLPRHPTPDEIPEITPSSSKQQTQPPPPIQAPPKAPSAPKRPTRPKPSTSMGSQSSKTRPDSPARTSSSPSDQQSVASSNFSLHNESPMTSIPQEVTTQSHLIGDSEPFIQVQSAIGIPLLFSDPKLNVLNQFCREYLHVRSYTKRQNRKIFGRESHFSRVRKSLRIMSKDAKGPFIVNESSPGSPALLLHLLHPTLASNSQKIRDVPVPLPSLKVGRTLTDARFSAIVYGCFHLFDRLKAENGVVTTIAASL